MQKEISYMFTQLLHTEIKKTQISVMYDALSQPVRVFKLLRTAGSRFHSTFCLAIKMWKKRIAFSE